MLPHYQAIHMSSIGTRKLKCTLVSSRFQLMTVVLDRQVTIMYRRNRTYYVREHV
jgi:hypothetical protein